MSEDVVARVHGYRSKLLSQEEWAEWGDSILGCIYVVRPSEPEDAARIVQLLTRFAADLIRWGMEPPIEQHLLLGRIERHVAKNMAEGSRRTRRRELIKIGRVANPVERWPQQQERIGRSKRQPGYDRGELRSLFRAALHQENPHDRRLFQVALSLGLHGYDGRSVRDVVRERIKVNGDVATITGDDLRPDLDVTGICAEWLSYWRERTAPEEPLIGPYHRFNSHLSKLRGEDNRTRLKMARLRTTFMVHLLQQPNLLQGEILQIAGLESTSSLDLYRCHVPNTDSEVVARKFRELPSLLAEGQWS